MNQAQLCPVCSGSGKHSDSHDGCTLIRDCHGCAGKGWVEVGGCDSSVPNYRSWPWNPYPPPYYTVTCTGDTVGDVK